VTIRWQIMRFNCIF